MVTKRKAVALISGGLDSMLAVRMVQEQGIEVEGINFYTGFCVEGHTHAIRNHDKKKKKRNNALWVAEQLGIKLHIIDVIEEYKDIVINPKHGYGAHLNPCLDCKGFMVRKAEEWRITNNFDFIITGEVVGQRPMSQTAKRMPIVMRESGAGNRLVRPLCARKLEATLPELEGWLDRSKLGEISGRSRKEQIALTRQWGIKDYAQPAGGCCFLTNQQYAAKLQDLWTSRGTREYELDDIMLLKVGRHIRPNADFKLIVCRDDGENNFATGYKNRFISLYANSHEGPLALFDGQASTENLKLAARIVARYGKGKHASVVTVQVSEPRESEGQELNVTPLDTTEMPREWIL
ncbi:MAG: tRNA (5-methylaminomethyl-2-thiouridylate)-methyltransferase [Proteobacteria bacterium]|jgi:tRNA-uridine 2-sulfurtransferase|nr:tRNA (5-methylaminomethyl-2-thiouridylate)-methyltransferase [Pseudomonadota bacterium]